MNPFVIAFFLGAAVTMFYAALQKTVVGKFIDKIADGGAHSPETSLSLADLGLSNRRLLLFFLTHGGGGRVVQRENERYYILEENMKKAQTIYNGKGVSFIGATLLLLILILSAFGVNYAIELLTKWFAQ